MSDDKATEATPEGAAPAKRRLSRHEAACSVAGCKRPYRAKTYCNVHYKAWRHGGIEGHTSRYKICTREACRKPRALGSVCAEHSKKEAAPAA